MSSAAITIFRPNLFFMCHKKFDFINLNRLTKDVASPVDLGMFAWGSFVP